MDPIPEGFEPEEKTSAPSVVPEGFEPEASPSDVPPGFEPEEERYSTPGQHALTGIEGIARGASAGLSDALAVGMRKGATAIGVPDEYLHYVAPAPEEIKGRKENNPIESTATEIVGNVGLMNQLPQMGSHALNGLLQMGIMSGGDELSNAMLGQGDPLPAVASHMAVAGALGLLTGGLFGKAEKLTNSGLKAIENSKVGNKLTSFLSGIGHAAQFPAEEMAPGIEGAMKQMASIPEDLHPSSFKTGQEVFNTLAGKATTKLVKYLADAATLKGGGSLGDLVATHLVGSYAEKLLNKVIPKASKKIIGPALLKMVASGSFEKAAQALDHASSVSRGASAINKGVEALFESGMNQYLDFETAEKEREKLREFIDAGGVDQQLRDQASSQEPEPPAFAEGGEVPSQGPQQVPPMEDLNQPSAVSTIWPEQNILLSSAKGRISGYLNSIKPDQHAAKLPYDKDHETPQHKKDYDKVLDLAIKPLSILKHIKHGTLIPSQVKHFTQMYPELYSHLSKKMTDHIMKHQLDKTKRPPYALRQSLSLFLGSNLESSLTPANMQAAQAVFANQKMQQQKPATKTNALNKIGEHAMTDDQSRERRLNKS